jgi:hypothetical protein
MEHFEQGALGSAAKKPAHWYRYVDDTFVVWPHGKELQDFLQHLNSIHPYMTFTMEMEHKKSLPFLDVRVSRKPDDLLGHTMYTKTYIHTYVSPCEVRTPSGPKRACEINLRR